MAYFEVKNLSIKLKDFFLKDINIKLKKKDYLCIIGPSGAGKSTLLDTIIGLLTPPKGKIFLNNHNITNYPIESRHIGIVYQNYALFPHLSVKQNIKYGLCNYSKKIRNEMVINICKLMSILHLIEKDTKKLSGGEKQRVALARALVVKPKLLLLDEPFSAVDSLTKKCLKRMIKDIISKTETTVIHVAHDLSDAFSMANKVAILERGKIHQIADKNIFFEKPKDYFTANFIDSTILKAKVKKYKGKYTVLKANGIDFLSLEKENIGRDVFICFRKEEVKISHQKQNEKNCINFDVKKVELESRGYNFILKKRGLKFSVFVSKPDYLKQFNMVPNSVFMTINPQFIHLIRE